MNKILVFLTVFLGGICSHILISDLVIWWQKILIGGFLLFIATVFAFLDYFLSKLSDEEWKAEISRKCFQKSGGEK